MFAPVAILTLLKALLYKEGGQEVKNSNRYCLGYSLQAGIVLTKPPGHRSRISGTKKPQYFRGAALPACWSSYAPIGRIVAVLGSSQVRKNLGLTKGYTGQPKATRFSATLQIAPLLAVR